MVVNSIPLSDFMALISIHFVVYIAYVHRDKDNNTSNEMVYGYKQHLVFIISLVTL